MRPYSAPCVLLFAAAATAQWSLQPTTTSPTNRTEAAMAYDVANSRVVLFGGAGVGVGQGLRGDTWTYDGVDWTQQAPATSPSARLGAKMVFDPVRGRTVLFGGIASLISIALPNNQTWEWDGTTWAQAAPTASPTGRAYYGLAYDLNRQRVVLFGGSTNPGLLITSNQTWEYDGLTWVQTATTSTANPGARQSPGMCYHAGMQRVVLFGGIDPQTGGNSTTWLYDGTNWTAAPVTGAVPVVRFAPQLVYDQNRSVCLLQGGSDPNTGAAIVDTWEFGGASWQQITAPEPTTRTRFVTAYDLGRGRTVLFGGTAGNTGLVDTWEYGAFVGDLGPGCAGSNGVPVLAGSTRPQLGGTFAAALSNLANGAPLGAIVAGLFANQPPLPLDIYGLPGCLLHTNVDAMLFLPVVGGAMTSSFPIPNDPGLFGVTIHEQGLSLDPSANAAGMVVSNAISAVLGW